MSWGGAYKQGRPSYTYGGKRQRIQYMQKSASGDDRKAVPVYTFWRKNKKIQIEHLFIKNVCAILQLQTKTD